MWCHLLLFVPVIGLGLFFVLPWPTALTLNVLLAGVAVGVAVPSIRALRRPVSTGPEALIGRLGEAVTDVERDGLVRHGGELWTALVPNGVRIPKGSPVVITEVQGVKLVVRPLGGNERPEGDAEVARRNGREE